MTKTPTLKKNKKALNLSTEMIMVAISLITLFIIFYINYNFTTGAKEEYTALAPNLTHQYPQTFIKTFLLMPLPKNELESLELDTSKTYLNKDLIIIDTELTKNYIKKIKKDYIKKYAYSIGDDISTFDYYKKFSNQHTLDPNKLLCISYDEQNGYSLNEELIRNNYFFYLKTNNNQFAFIKFNC